MAIDLKYGKVTLQNGTIGEDEPVVVFRGRDKLLPRLLEYYHMMCTWQESGEWHLELIDRCRNNILAWQGAHPDLVRTPTSEAARLWLVTQEDPPEPPPAPAAELEPLPDAGAASEPGETSVSLGVGTA